MKEIRNLTFTKENLISISIIFIIFFIDFFSKNYVLNNFSENTFYVNSFINFDLTWNTGIGFGLFSSESNLIYNSISVLIILVIFFLLYLAIKSDNFDKIIFSIIIGGALGNFYNRIFYKAVPDFIDLHYNNFHWFTFNIADIFITIGIILFILKSFFEKNLEKK